MSANGSGVIPEPWPSRALPRGASSIQLLDGVESPQLIDALELGCAPVLKDDSGPGYEVAHRAGDENFPWERLRGDAGADVHCDAADFFVDRFALAGVQAGANLESETVHCFRYCGGAADRAGGSVKSREEPVAGGVEFASSETG